MMVESTQACVLTRRPREASGFRAGALSGGTIGIVFLGGALSLTLLGCGAGSRQPVVVESASLAAPPDKDVSQAQMPADGIGGHATTQPVRSREAVSAEMMSLPMAIWAAIPEDMEVSDVAARRKVGEKVVPLARRMCSVIDESGRLPACRPTRPQDTAAAKVQFEALLIVFGDIEFEAATRTLAAGEGEAAINARLCLASADMALAGKVEAAAEAAASVIIGIAERSPNSDPASFLLFNLRDDERLSEQTHRTADRLLREVMTSTVAGLLKRYPTTQKIGG